MYELFVSKRQIATLFTISQIHFEFLIFGWSYVKLVRFGPIPGNNLETINHHGWLKALHVIDAAN